MHRLAPLLIILLTAIPARAQVPDTMAVADTLATAPDTLVASSPPPPAAPDSVVAFFRDRTGSIIRRHPPERSTALHLSEWLVDVPHGFLHTFRTAGWPDGWSPQGFAPDAAVMRRDGYAHVHLMTGRPAMEMIPFGLMEPPSLAPAIDGGAMGIVLDTRTFDQARPLTGLRYQSDNLGLQHVEAYHAQRRLATLFGRRGELNLSAAYLGRGATGEYPGSALQRERGLFGRVRFARPTWSVQITSLYGRQRIGAHGGVVPWTGGPYETIYSRIDAVVRNAGARRFTIRNDLDARLRTIVRGQMLDVAAYRTSESFRYLHSSGADSTRIHRSGMVAVQSLSPGPSRLQVRVEGWVEQVEDDAALPANLDRRRYAAAVHVRDSLAVGAFGIIARVGIRRTDAGSRPEASIRTDYASSRLRLFAEGSLASIDVPRIAVQGFGTHARASDGLVPGRAISIRAGAALDLAPFQFEVDGFATRERDRLLPLIVDDVLRFVQAPVSADRVGVSIRAAYRADERRGVYADVRGNALHWLSLPRVAGAAPLSEAQPAFWGSTRLGARMLLFQGDLDADLYLRGLAWTGMRGRLLHAPTGLLTVPDAGARWFNPSGVLDVMLEAQVRTATIFVGFENVLSGTKITLGNLIVPDYPLPERRFRLGVYWPIED